MALRRQQCTALFKSQTRSLVLTACLARRVPGKNREGTPEGLAKSFLSRWQPCFFSNPSSCFSGPRFPFWFMVGCIKQMSPKGCKLQLGNVEIHFGCPILEFSKALKLRCQLMARGQLGRPTTSAPSFPIFAGRPEASNAANSQRTFRSASSLTPPPSNHRVRFARSVPFPFLRRHVSKASAGREVQGLRP